MDNRNNDIDQLLFNQLSNASMDGDGIDWNSFKQRQRKRRLIVLLCSILLLLLISCLSMFMFESKKSTPLTYSDRGPTVNDSEKYDLQNGVLNIEDNHDLMPPADTFIRDENKAEIFVINKPATTETVVMPEENNNFETDVQDEIHTTGEQKQLKIEQININKKEVPEIFHYKPGIFNPVKVNPDISHSMRLKESGLYFEIQAGPCINIPNFRVTSSGREFVHKDYEKIRQVSETGIGGYNVQLSIGKSVKRWSYSIGAGFSNMTILGDYNFIYSEKPVIDIDGEIKSYLISNPALIRFNSRQTISFIEVPVNVQYVLISGKRFNTSLNVGYIIQFLNRIDGQLPNAVFLDQRENLSTENFKTKTSCIQSGLQFSFKINKNSDFILAPDYRRVLGLNQIQSRYKTKFNYWGLNLIYRVTL